MEEPAHGPEPVTSEHDTSHDLSALTREATSKIEEKGHAALDAVHSTIDTAKHKLHLDHVRASGPGKLFNPTKIHFNVRWDHADHDASHENASNDRIELLWRSRDNRKGRHSVAVPLNRQKSRQRAEDIKIHLKRFFTNVWRMLSTFPYWNMSFWGGWSYSIGSMLFVADGAFAWSPTAFPDTEFEAESTYAVPLCFFFGALFYQVGATMAYLEAINDGSFAGSGLKRLLEGHGEDQKKLLDEHLHSFFGHLIPHHSKTDEEKTDGLADGVDPNAGWRTKDRRERPGSIYPSGKAPAPSRRGGVDMGPSEEGQVSEYNSWRWWPTWHAFRTHHIRDIGYVACTIQLFGATLYGITGIVVLPGILDGLEPWQELGAYWVPQVVASMCFLTAGVMFTLENQGSWYKPEPTSIGWWIGFWATVGSVGFLLSAAFSCASDSSSAAEYQSSLSSMWGSAAYLLSALHQ